jgi:hypothetical protein
MWGSYYWHPRWRWYFTVSIAASTLVFVDRLPDEADDGPECTSAVLDGETIYICDGVLYRATYYEDEQVYEIISEPYEVVNLGG